MVRRCCVSLLDYRQPACYCVFGRRRAREHLSHFHQSHATPLTDFDAGKEPAGSPQLCTVQCSGLFLALFLRILSLMLMHCSFLTLVVGTVGRPQPYVRSCSCPSLYSFLTLGHFFTCMCCPVLSDRLKENLLALHTVHCTAASSVSLWPVYAFYHDFPKLSAPFPHPK